MSDDFFGRDRTPRARYNKGDFVHISQLEEWGRKTTFVITNSYYNRMRSCIEYQLEDFDGTPYLNGAWVKERDLSLTTESDSSRTYGLIDDTQPGSDSRQEPDSERELDSALDSLSKMYAEFEKTYSDWGQYDTAPRAKATSSSYHDNAPKYPWKTADSKLSGKPPAKAPALGAESAAMKERIEALRREREQVTDLRATNLQDTIRGPPYVCERCKKAFVYRKDHDIHKTNCIPSSRELRRGAGTERSIDPASLILEDVHEERYMFALIKYLTRDLFKADKSIGTTIISALPALVTACTEKASKWRWTMPDIIPSRMAREFLVKYSDPLIMRLRIKLQEHDYSVTRLSNADHAISMSEEKVQNWMDSHLHAPKSSSPEAQFERAVPQEEAIDDFELSAVPAFNWLRARLRREIEMDMEEACTMQEIQRQIYQIAGSSEEDTICRARIIVHWNPFHFLLGQDYEEPGMVALYRAITLTGGRVDAQAMTTAQYVLQTWSFIGEGVLMALNDKLVDGHTATLEDGTELFVTLPDSSWRKSNIIQRDTVKVRVNGRIDAVIEVAQIFAWLGCALRKSPRQRGVVGCVPSISYDKSRMGMTSVSRRLMFFDINFKFLDYDTWPDDRALQPPGQCWHDIFLNPVVAEGFPIPARSKDGKKTGLEMPLGIISTLARSHRITRFAGGLYIKSFSAILILTQQAGDLLIWHLVFDEDGEYLSYSDPRVRRVAPIPADSVSVATLENSRHVLGWCEKVKSNVGGPLANYNIDWSGLPKPHGKCAFDKVSISAGYFISSSVSAALGKKDKPVYIKSRDDYTTRLKWIAKKYVVLYDLEDRRAWLADGVSTLLHLVRASLEHDSQDSFKELFRYKSELFEEAGASKSGKAAAISVLTNATNQDLEIYQKPDSNSAETTIKQTGEIEEVNKRTKTFFRFKDRVDQIYHLLEQIIAYQSQLDSEDGVGFRIKYTPRRQLEGFDFMDIASDEDPFWPRVTTLRAKGAGWVDFTRAIHAITLFGSGFGDLLKPHDKDQTCINWTEVPKGHDYLAVCASDLKEILRKRGSMREEPWRLVDDIYWHTPDKLFERCRCSSKSSEKECDHVQVLLPAKFPKVWGHGLTSPSKLQGSGAIIFGHSRKFPLRWADQEDCPALGEPPGEDDLVDAFQDSGLGESIGGSTLSGSSGGHASNQSSQGKKKRGVFDGFQFSSHFSSHFSGHFSKRERSKSPAGSLD